MYADLNSWSNDRSLFENIFVSLGFAYDFAFCQNKWSLKIFLNVLWSMSFENDKLDNYFWGGNSYKKYQTK
jgi:hypothetical protein